MLWQKVTSAAASKNLFSITVNSVGAPGVSISASPSTYAGITNYTKINIPIGTSITFTAPKSPASGLDFYGWSGVNIISGEAYKGEVTLNSDKSITAFYEPITTSYSGNVLAFNTNKVYVPYLVLPWDDSIGFAGNRFSQPTNPQPTNGRGVVFSPDGTVLIFNDSSGGAYAYRWSATGFGTKYNNSSSFSSGSNSTNDIAFHPSGNVVARASLISPYVQAVAWSNTNGFGSKYADPIVPPASSANTVVWSPSGNYIAVGHDRSGVSTSVTVYPWSASTGFGAKYSNPSTIPSGSVIGVAFNPTETAIAVAHTNAPYISVYAWSASGFGSKYSNPATLPNSAGRHVAFHPSGNSIVVAVSSAPGVFAYPWSDSTGFGTKYADPYPSIGLVDSLSFTGSGAALAISGTASGSSSGAAVYSWSNSTGFGAKYSDPSNPIPAVGGLKFKG